MGALRAGESRGVTGFRGAGFPFGRRHGGGLHRRAPPAFFAKIVEDNVGESGTAAHSETQCRSVDVTSRRARSVAAMTASIASLCA